SPTMTARGTVRGTRNRSRWSRGWTTTSSLGSLPGWSCRPFPRHRSRNGSGERGAAPEWGRGTGSRPGNRNRSWKTRNEEQGTGNGVRSRSGTRNGSGERGTGNRSSATGNRSPRNGSGERGTGNRSPRNGSGERGTGSALSPTARDRERGPQEGGRRPRNGPRAVPDRKGQGTAKEEPRSPRPRRNGSGNGVGNGSGTGNGQRRNVRGVPDTEVAAEVVDLVGRGELAA